MPTERLLLDVIEGDSTLFMRRDEVEAAWAWVDPILKGWQEYYQGPRPYPAGRNGPEQAAPCSSAAVTSGSRAERYRPLQNAGGFSAPC